MGLLNFFRKYEVKIIAIDIIREIINKNGNRIKFMEFLIPEDSSVGETLIEDGKIINIPLNSVDGMVCTSIGTPCVHIVYKTGVDEFWKVYYEGSVDKKGKIKVRKDEYKEKYKLCYSKIYKEDFRQISNNKDVSQRVINKKQKEKNEYGNIVTSVIFLKENRSGKYVCENSYDEFD